MTLDTEHHGSRWLTTAFLAVTLAIFACWPASAAAAEPADFVLRKPDEGTLRLSDYRGRWVIVNFWATWCPPCIREIPELVAFHREQENNNAMVLGVNFEQLESLVLEAFVEDHGMVYPNGQAGDQPLIPFEPLVGLPTTFLVNPAGEVVKRQTGPITKQWLEEWLRDARSGS